ncbi:PD-(D/E)XK nuclease family protein [Blastococcus sp. SYSU D00820]
MTDSLWARVEPLVTQLNDSPLYRTSQAGMELWHSNVLGWVFRSYPEAAGPLADELGAPHAEAYDVRREWRKLDFAAVLDDGSGVVLENKVGSLPDTTQLRGYHEDLTEHAPAIAENASFVLLSLMPPVEELPAPWRRIGYDTVSRAMGEVAARLPAGFDASFTTQYTGLTRSLAALGEAVSSSVHPSEPYFLDGATDQRLRAVGFRDLLLKLRNVDLVQSIRKRVEEAPSGDFETYWSRQEPTASYYSAVQEVPGLGPVRLGWQMQGRSLRLVALLQAAELSGPGAALVKAREAAADAYLTAWLAPEHLDRVLPGRITPYSGKKTYNHFAPNFIYRYSTVSQDVTPAELVPALAELTRLADAFLAQLAGDQD